MLVGPARAGQLGRAVGALRDLEVVTVALADDAPVRLAGVRAETGLRLTDCSVLMAAEQANAALATFDDRLATTARNRGHPVRNR